MLEWTAAAVAEETRCLPFQSSPLAGCVAWTLSIWTSLFHRSNIILEEQTRQATSVQVLLRTADEAKVWTTEEGGREIISDQIMSWMSDLNIKRINIFHFFNALCSLNKSFID